MSNVAPDVSNVALDCKSVKHNVHCSFFVQKTDVSGMADYLIFFKASLLRILLCYVIQNVHYGTDTTEASKSIFGGFHMYYINI